MKKKFEIAGLSCLCSVREGSGKIAYVLYPMDVLDGWIEDAAARYDTTIVVVTGMDWDNVFSPWPAPGQPPGSPDFKGQSMDFLKLLTSTVVPEAEAALGLGSGLERSLVGVSMSGLFALWEWMQCDVFANMASLSGSFWFPGFLEWFEARPVPEKSGKGYFLLGSQEAKSPVKAFQCVEVNTREIVSRLEKAGLNITFQMVPGNHFVDAIPRLDRAFQFIR